MLCTEREEGAALSSFPNDRGLYESNTFQHVRTPNIYPRVSEGRHFNPLPKKPPSWNHSWNHSWNTETPISLIYRNFTPKTTFPNHTM